MRKKFEDLRVWKLAHEIVLDIYKANVRFPVNEKFGLETQLKRAVTSVPANIAEGYKRQYTRELIQFLSIAIGSLEETRYFLLLIKDLNYIDTDDYDNLVRKISKLDKMLDNFILNLKRQTK